MLVHKSRREAPRKGYAFPPDRIMNIQMTFAAAYTHAIAHTFDIDINLDEHLPHSITCRALRFCRD